ncbi:hypothetical protein CLOM_g4390 [Closterium sp. NIES-68]|nr:hypothetical protein CLOM_g15266 [Closterium sp. NIES-68]GJP45004.1 hypothetical protein CLOM_g4390 [Closterium sp. NIES-68]GJP86952.1 hypothetical protein CLOP_g16912 [Closterium sp. NIES-67]
MSIFWAPRLSRLLGKPPFHPNKSSISRCSLILSVLLLSAAGASPAIPIVAAAAQPRQPTTAQHAGYRTDDATSTFLPTGLVRVHPTSGNFRDSLSQTTVNSGTGNNDTLTSSVSRAAELTRRRQRRQGRRERQRQKPSESWRNGSGNRWRHSLYGGSPGMSYHGGPIMSSPINVYIVFYGSWSRKDRRAVNAFVESVSDNSVNPTGVASVRRWWRTTSLYTGKGGVTVTSQVRLAKSAVDRYSRGRLMKNDMDGVWQVIRSQIDSGVFPIDASGMYVVLTSADVRLGDSSQGFCGPQGYCGWHSTASNGRSELKVIHVGNGGQQCPQYCVPSYNTRSSPNGLPGLDGLINTLAHEMAETATNPLIDNGWFDISTLEEIADKCARLYGQKGKEVVLSNQGYAYNAVGKGGTHFLLQQLWSRQSRQKCVMQGPA